MHSPRALVVLGDWLAFASLLPAAVAAALLTAARAAMGLPPDGVTAALAAAGTIVVYGVDRLRDVRADRATAPLRTAFVERHRGKMAALAIAAGVAGVALASRTTRDVQLLCAGVLTIGLLHRRLKDASLWKAVYVTAAWVCVTAGIPALVAIDRAPVPWVLAVYGAAIGSNLLATRQRAATEPASLWSARGLALIGVATAVAAPAPVTPLAAIPASELLALAAFRTGERYGLVVVDGALLAGALLALAALP
jgi:hypothetical protein